MGRIKMQIELNNSSSNANILLKMSLVSRKIEFRLLSLNVCFEDVKLLRKLKVIISNLYFEVGQWRTQEFFSGGGVQQIQLRTEDRENGDLGALAP